MNKQLLLLDKRIALSRLSSIIRPNDLCYLLSKDYSSYLKLNKLIPDECAVLNLSGKLQKKIKSLRKPYLDLFAKLSKKYNSIEWWGMNIASRNSASIPLQLNITYLFYLKFVAWIMLYESALCVGKVLKLKNEVCGKRVLIRRVVI